MNDFDSKKLDGLLENGKFAEAKEYINSVFAGPESKNAKVDMAIDYALVYAKILNSIQTDYLKSLNEAVKILQRAKVSENRASDAVKLTKLKSDFK